MGASQVQNVFETKLAVDLRCIAPRTEQPTIIAKAANMLFSVFAAQPDKFRYDDAFADGSRYEVRALHREWM